MKRPYVKYRPVRTFDDEGGFTDSYEDPGTIFGVVTVEETETHMHVDIREDILIDDVIEVDEEV